MNSTFDVRVTIHLTEHKCNFELSEKAIKEAESVETHNQF
jgi:hypothetical protein